MCPNTLATIDPNHHAATESDNSNDPNAFNKYPIPSVGNNPFNTSNPKHRKKYFLPNTRPTFVAPIFPLPTFRTSTPLAFPIK
jgi:hypothetical protein